MTEPLNQPLPTSSPASSARPDEDLRAAEPLPYRGASGHTDMQPGQESPPATPRWVKVFGIIAIVLVLLFVGLHVTGNVPTHTPSSSSTEHGMQTP
jgi:hypothetical protein